MTALPDGKLSANWPDVWKGLVGGLSLYCGDVPLAEELAQEAIVRYLSNPKSVRNPEALSAWLFRVGVNLANSRWRRKRAESKAYQRARTLRLETLAPQQSEEDAEVRDAVARLPRRYKEVLVLRFFYDWGVRETAEALDLPENTVKTRTRRGLTRLREAGLGAYEEAQGERNYSPTTP